MAQSSNHDDLLVDVGGTRIRVAQGSGGRIASVDVHPTAVHPTLGDVLKNYLSPEHDGSKRPVFVGVAAPVGGATIKLTNADFLIDKERLAETFPRHEFHFLNDVEALAHGLTAVDPAMVARLRGGDAIVDGPRLVIAPGTGLGAALLLTSGDAPSVLSTEFGQVTLGVPRRELLPLFNVLIEKLGRLSIEALVSGPGLLNIHAGLSCLNGDARAFEKAISTERLEQEARANAHSTAAEATRVFSELLGSVCGDGAFAYKATGGVFLAGSLINALADLIDLRAFDAAFSGKGPLSHFVAPIPVSLMKDTEPVLSGLLAYATRHRNPRAPSAL